MHRRPDLPELPGLREARPWTNREATGSHMVPGRLAIVGGGGVGVEMASAWSGLGTSVTLLARADGLPQDRATPAAWRSRTCRP